LKGEEVVLRSVSSPAHCIGLPLGAFADSKTSVTKTRKPFAWRLLTNAEDGSFSFAVPSSCKYLTMFWSTGNAPVPTDGSVKIWATTQDPLHRDVRWRLEDAGARQPVEDERLYKIVGAPSGTVMHAEVDGKVAGYPYNEGRNQLWRASCQDERGAHFVAFQNFATGQYLAFDLPPDVVEDPQHGARLLTAENPFHWQLVRDPEDASGYRLLVPFQRINADLHNGDASPGTPIHLYSPIADKYWTFEEVPVMVPYAEYVTGPPERTT